MFISQKTLSWVSHVKEYKQNTWAFPKTGSLKYKCSEGNKVQLPECRTSFSHQYSSLSSDCV